MFFIFLLSGCLSAAELTGFPGHYNYAYDDFGGRNWLYFTSAELERRNIRVVAVNFHTKAPDNLDEAAAAWMLDNPGRDTVLIMLDRKKSRAKLALSEGLIEKTGKGFAERTERAVLLPTLWRWYIPVNKSLAKALGALIYELDKPYNPNAPDIHGFRNIIRPEGRFYTMSAVFPGREITALFFLEPVSFMIYFPMVTFYVFVNLFGRVNGPSAYGVMKWVWAAFMVFTAALIWGRVNAVYPEFMFMFKIFLGATLPMYVYAILMYDREIYMAAYRYISGITGGGFNESNAFEGRNWSAPGNSSGRGNFGRGLQGTKQAEKELS